ncbi:ArsR/SmtB family transcription factor [Specibacter cremeus]|uniref:ArsR/SmtB family transcription factor n=1 Tax=Specibacter cremeus TaxID=1629051 RepID=UPI000F778E59|nr:metalloregulator ArsR/SmtB family transcription factor [Specibacter cremeus]
MAIEDVFAVIAEATRRDILDALADEHKSVGQLVEELGVSQPTVSKHLRVLRESGLVAMRAQGQKRFYSLNAAPLHHVAAWLTGLGAGAQASAAPAGEPADELPADSPVPDGDPVRQTLAPIAGRVDHEGTVQQQISRSVGRAANKAADLLANLPKRKFGRKRD